MISLISMRITEASSITFGMMPGDENTPFYFLDDFLAVILIPMVTGILLCNNGIDAHDVPDDDGWVHCMFDMYDNDDSGGLDYYSPRSTHSLRYDGRQ